MTGRGGATPARQPRGGRWRCSPDEHGPRLWLVFARRALPSSNRRCHPV